MGFFLTVFASLFTVVNPFGTMPVFIGLMNESTDQEKKRVAIKASFVMMIVLTMFFFAGTYIIGFFSISITALRIGGGLIITSSGFALLTGKFSKHKGMNKDVKSDAESKDDVSITPLALPMLAGPGSISLLIGMHIEQSSFSKWILIECAIIAVSVVTFLILRFSPVVLKKLGASGLNALSRTIGFFVIALGIEYILGSINSLVSSFIN